MNPRDEIVVVVDERNRVVGAAPRDGAVILQREEIASGGFLPIDQVLERSETELFTPDGLQVLRLYLNLKPELGTCTRL